jgi:amino acid transporter
MGRSGVLPAALGKVNPRRKTPVNAIHLEVAVNVVAFVCVIIWKADIVFFTWANAITIGLVLMYILANIGVVKYYLTEGRSQLNVLLHVIIPVVASAAGVVVVWKSYFSPFPYPRTGPVYWGLLVFGAVLLITIVALIYLRVTHREDWMRKAQLVFEQSGGGH